MGGVLFLASLILTSEPSVPVVWSLLCVSIALCPFHVPSGWLVTKRSQMNSDLGCVSSVT